MRKRFYAVGLVWILLQMGCANRARGRSVLGTPCAVSSATLKQDWQALRDALQTSEGCTDGNGLRCDDLRMRIRRLAIDCPGNPSVLLANAVLSFEERDYARTRQLLDELAGLGAADPDAGVLQGRLALQDGNAQAAIRVLRQHIRQFGDHAGLRETYASALYFQNRWDEAIGQLLTARELGAPAWRIAYGLGLIEEGRANYAAAKGMYEETLRQRPGWNPAESHLRALLASGKLPGNR